MTDVKTARDVLEPCPFCGGSARLWLPTCRPNTPYNPADRLFPSIRCSLCFAEACGRDNDQKGVSAIVAWNKRATAGYQITPVRADDAIAWFWREKATGTVGACMSEKHRVDTAASPNYEVFPVFAHPAADAVAGAGRDANARIVVLEEAAIICANIATEWQCCKRSENPTWEASMRAADECTDAIRAEIDVANADAGVERNGTVTIGFHPKEARFTSAACRAEADRAVDPNDCVLLHIIADEIDAALAPATGEVQT